MDSFLLFFSVFSYCSLCLSPYLSLCLLPFLNFLFRFLCIFFHSISTFQKALAIHFSYCIIKSVKI